MIRFLLAALLFPATAALLIAQPVPAHISIEPGNYTSRVSGLLKSQIRHVGASGLLKVRAVVEEGQPGKVTGMEDRNVMRVTVKLTATLDGQTIDSGPIEGQGAGRSVQEAKTRAVKSLKRDDAWRKWVEEVQTMSLSAKPGPCPRLGLIGDVSGVSKLDLGYTIRYVESLQGDEACGQAAAAFNERLAERYAAEQCERLAEIEVAVRAKTYNARSATRTLQRVKPESPCWETALSLADSIGADRARLAAKSEEDWRVWFAKGVLVN